MPSPFTVQSKSIGGAPRHQPVTGFRWARAEITAIDPALSNADDPISEAARILTEQGITARTDRSGWLITEAPVSVVRKALAPASE